MKIPQLLASAPNVDKTDIIHKAMTWQVGLLPVILVWGLTLETLHACELVKGSFDLQAFFTAILFYETGVATLLGSATASMFFRKTSSPETPVAPDPVPTPPKTEITVNQNG